MIPPPVYVGADMAKDSIELGCPDLAVPGSIANTAAGFRLLLKSLSRCPSAVPGVCEATGPYHKAFVAALHEARVAVSGVNPPPVRNFPPAPNRLAKTDAIDAPLLAH